MLHDLTLTAPSTAKDRSTVKVQVGRIEWDEPCPECKKSYGEVLVVRIPTDNIFGEPETIDYFTAPCGHQFQRLATSPS